MTLTSISFDEYGRQAGDGEDLSPEVLHVSPYPRQREEEDQDREEEQEQEQECSGRNAWIL